MVRDEVLQAAGSTTGAGSVVDLGAAHSDVTVYVIGTGTITGGSVQVETAYTPGYSGSWAAVGSAVTNAALTGGKTAIVQAKGPLRCVRANIASNITGGGSIEAHVVARS